MSDTSADETRRKLLGQGGMGAVCLVRAPRGEPRFFDCGLRVEVEGAK